MAVLGPVGSASGSSQLHYRGSRQQMEQDTDVRDVAGSWRLSCVVQDAGPSVNFEDNDNSGKPAVHPFWEL